MQVRYVANADLACTLLNNIYKHTDLTVTRKVVVSLIYSLKTVLM